MLLAGAAAAVLVAKSPDERGDVAGMPDATVWVRSSVESVGGQLHLNVGTDEIVVRNGPDEHRPQWICVGREIKTSIGQTGDARSAKASVAGTVGYVAPRRRWNWLKLRSDTVFISSTFEFTGESDDAPDGTRWWRLRRVTPAAPGGS